jgi:hypothetical protein
MYVYVTLNMKGEEGPDRGGGGDKFRIQKVSQSRHLIILSVSFSLPFPIPWSPPEAANHQSSYPQKPGVCRARLNLLLHTSGFRPLHREQNLQLQIVPLLQPVGVAHQG